MHIFRFGKIDRIYEAARWLRAYRENVTMDWKNVEVEALNLVASWWGSLGRVVGLEFDEGEMAVEKCGFHTLGETIIWNCVRRLCVCVRGILPRSAAALCEWNACVSENWWDKWWDRRGLGGGSPPHERVGKCFQRSVTTCEPSAIIVRGIGLKALWRREIWRKSLVLFAFNIRKKFLKYSSLSSYFDFRRRWNFREIMVSWVRNRSAKIHFQFLCTFQHCCFVVI